MKAFIAKIIGLSSFFLAKTALAATFVLVHGAFGSAHVWDAAKQSLATAGHHVITVNLPAHGGDLTSLNHITLADYVVATEQAIVQVKEKVVLVGHSLAGMVISQVAEDMPGKIERLVYISAFLPKNGDSAFELFKNDKESILGKYLDFSQDKNTATIRSEGRIVAVCADCPESVQAILAKNDGVEAMQPFADTVNLSSRYFGQVPKAYLFTSKDKALGYAEQQSMVKHNGKVERTAVLHTSHLPFLVNPELFSQTLVQLARP